MTDYETYIQNMFADMPARRKEVLESFALSLHNASLRSKYLYLNRLKVFGEKVGKPFQEVNRRDVDAFMSGIEKDGTYNSYVQTLKMFFKWLKKEDVVSELKPRRIDISVSPAELLTTEEVVQLANTTGSVMWKSLILTLYESAARISEILQLKVGDVEFHSVRRKEGGRGLVATLYFRRSKGKVKKQPVAISMFAAELKKWVESHPLKNNPQAYLFFSTKYDTKAETPLDASSVRTMLYRAKKLTGIKKRVNPHWLRHSMLSYWPTN